MCCAWPETSRCGETWCQLSASSPWSQLVTSPCTTACDSGTLSHFDLWSALCTPKGLFWWLWRCWTWKDIPANALFLWMLLGVEMVVTPMFQWWGNGPCLPAFSCRHPHLQHVGAFTSESIFFLFDFHFFFLKCHCLELNHLVCSECYFNRAARKTGVPLQNQEPQTMCPWQWKKRISLWPTLSTIYLIAYPYENGVFIRFKAQGKLF